MKSHWNYFLIVSIFLSITLIFAGQSLAGDIDAKLPDNDNTSAFQVKDSNDNVLIKVQSGGNVGIGTTSPSANYKLTVDGDGSSYGIYVNNVGDTGIESNGYNYGLRASGRSRAIQGTSTNGYGIYGQSTNSFAGYFVGDGYISGNVGIGTTSPQAPLEVRYSSPNSSWGVPALILDNPAGGSRTALSFNIDGETMAYFNATNNETLVLNRDGDFRIANYGNTRQDFTVSSSGNVGIGTTSPTYKLHVNGIIAGTGYVNLSSRDYKEEIQKVNEAAYQRMLAELMKMDLTTYKYKKEYGGDDDRKLGFIAEDMPEDVLSKDGKGIDTYELLALTIGAIKAQQRENEVLKAKLKEVMTRLEAIGR